MLRDSSDGYSETINLANNLYYVSNGGQYSRLRNGFPVTVSADGGVHQFEIAPVAGSGGRHIVRPLRPTFPFVYDRDALRFDGINFFSQGRAVGRVSLAVDLFADSTYNPDASTHSAGRSGIYRRLYDRQQSNNGSDLIAVLASVARADTGLTVVTRLRTRGVSRGRAGVTRVNFCPPTGGCLDVQNERFALPHPNDLPGVPSSVGEYSVFLPLPPFYLYPAINLTAFLPNGETLVRQSLFLADPNIYASGGSYPNLQSGRAVDLRPFVQDGFTVNFRLTPLGGLLSIGYLIPLPELLASGQVTFSVSFEENGRWCNLEDSDPNDGGRVLDAGFCNGPMQQVTIVEEFNLFNSADYYPLQPPLTEPDCFNENGQPPAEDYRTMWETGLGLRNGVLLPTQLRPLAFGRTRDRVAPGFEDQALGAENVFVWAVTQISRIVSGQRVDVMRVGTYEGANQYAVVGGVRVRSTGRGCNPLLPGRDRPVDPLPAQTFDFDFPTAITVDELRISFPDGGAVGGYSEYIDLPPLLIGNGRTRVDLNDPAFYAPDPDDPGRPIFLTLSRLDTPNVINSGSRELNLLSGHEFRGQATFNLLDRILLARNRLCDASVRPVVCIQRPRTSENEIEVFSIPRRDVVTVAMSDLGFNTQTRTIPQGSGDECVNLIGYSPANSYRYLEFAAGSIPTPTVYSCVRIVDAAEGAGQDLLFEHRLAENDQSFRTERFPYEPRGFVTRLIPASVVATVGYPIYELIVGAEDDPILTIDLNNPNFYLDGVVRPDFPNNPGERVALITLALAGVTLANGALMTLTLTDITLTSGVLQPQTLYLQGATATVNTDFDFVVLPAGITIPSRFDNKISINSYVTDGPLLSSDRLVFIEEPISDTEIVVEPGELRFVSEWHGGGNGPFLINSGANANTDRYLRSQPPNPYSSVYFDPMLSEIPGTETRIATGVKTDFEPVRTWHYIETGGGVNLSVNSPDSFLGGDRMEDPGRREYEPVGEIYEMTADPAYWASAQPQLSHTRANHIVGGLDGFGDSLIVSVIQATVAILGSPATLTITEPRTVTVAAPRAFDNGEAFVIVDPRGEVDASQHPLNAVNYRTPYRRISPSGRKFLTRSQTPAMPLRDAFSSVPQYHNVWYRLRDDATYRYLDSGNETRSIPIRAGAIINPVQGTYVNPPSTADIDISGVNIRYYNRFGSLNNQLNLRQPAMILPAGAVYIVGGSPRTERDQLPRITNVQAAVFFSVRPLSGIGCELAGERNVFGQPGQPVPPVLVINQQGPKPDVLRNAAGVAIRSRTLPGDPDNPDSPSHRDNRALVEDAFVRYTDGIEDFTLGHPCEWLDEIENTDGDSIFFYRSRDAIGGEIGARHIGNDRTYIMGGTD